MKVLITGSTGQLGHALINTCPEDINLVLPDRQAFDLADLTSLHRNMSEIAPDILINSASYTAVDKAEEEQDLCEQINANAVRIMAAYCQDHSIPMIQVSTDYVFDGGQNTPYSVADTPNPVSQYGHSKYLGELAALENCPEVYIVRSSWLYSEHGSNFVKTMLRLARNGNDLRVVDDQFGSPTYAHTLAAFIWQVLEQRPEQQLLHCSDNGQISWYEFAVAVFEEALKMGLLNEQPNISACSSNVYRTLAQRPAYSVLECGPSFVALGRSQTDWRETLQTMLAHLKDNTGIEYTEQSVVGL